jgi:hypothetical protein
MRVKSFRPTVFRINSQWRFHSSPHRPSSQLPQAEERFRTLSNPPRSGLPLRSEPISVRFKHRFHKLPTPDHRSIAKIPHPVPNSSPTLIFPRFDSTSVTLHWVHSSSCFFPLRSLLVASFLRRFFLLPLASFKQPHPIRFRALSPTLSPSAHHIAQPRRASPSPPTAAPYPLHRYSAGSSTIPALTGFKSMYRAIVRNASSPSPDSLPLRRRPSTKHTLEPLHP